MHAGICRGPSASGFAEGVASTAWLRVALRRAWALRGMSLDVGSSLPVLAGRCGAAVRVLVPSLAAVWGGVYVHVLYLGGVVGPWGYLAAAAAALAALFVPGGRRMEGLEALEYLYRWRRVCVAAAPLRALAAAAMAALAALSVAVFLHPPHLLYAEVQESSAVGNLTFYTVSVVRAVPGGGRLGRASLC
jgi:hypothetical protein